MYKFKNVLTSEVIIIEAENIDGAIGEALSMSEHFVFESRVDL